MEKNTDERIVVMDRDVFHTLLGHAQAGAVETGGEGMAEAMRHIRRFNPVLGAEHRARRKAAAKAAADDRRATREFLTRHAGGMVFMKSIFTGRYEMGRVLSEVRDGDGRRLLRVDFGGTTGVLKCHYSRLLEAEPILPPPTTRAFLNKIVANARSPY